MAQRDKDRPMVVQPTAHDATVPTQMLPIMPTAEQAEQAPAAASTAAAKNAESNRQTEPSARTKAVRAAKATVLRRNSLRKQRKALKAH